MIDQEGRNIDYMRISITDRCNLRCKYCMPEGIECIHMDEILTYEEILRVVKIASKLGIKVIKITGGEPLVRKRCANLVKMIKEVEGIEKVTITTNGILLDKYLDDLINAGIDGINISMDTTNSKLFEKITGFDESERLKKNIELCKDLSIPVKINAVSFDLVSFAKKYDIELDSNDSVLQYAKDSPIDVRFIEMMPIGEGKSFETIDHSKLLQELKSKYDLEKDETKHGYGPAVYYKIPGWLGSVGFISAIHGKFCDSCNRIRMTSEGFIKPCLCYDTGLDLKSYLRNNKSDEEILDVLRSVIFNKPKAHCFEELEKISERKRMIHIGG